MVEWAFDSKGTDRARIVHFLSEVKKFLEELVHEEQYEYLFYPELRSLARKAWPHLSRYFNEAKDAVENISDNKLDSHGLTGEQLNGKLGVVDFFSQKFLKNKLRKFLIRLLKAIETLLKSILSALGVSGAIDEFKELLENAVKEDEQ